MSNSMRALKLDDRDRRWYVPRVTEELRPHEHWIGLHDWLDEDGLAKIAYWAQGYVIEHGHVQRGLHAPASERKREVVMANMSDGEQFVAELGDRLRDMAERRLMRLDKVRSWLASKKSGIPRYGDGGRFMLEKPETIAKVLRDCGLKTSRQQFREHGQQFRVAANFDIPLEAKWEELRSLLAEPHEVYGEPATI
jgi:hypothetical protein